MLDTVHDFDQRITDKTGTIAGSLKCSTNPKELLTVSIVRAESNQRMSQVVSHAGTVYTAGQVAEGATVAAQTQAILGQIEDLLASAGSSKQHILSATIWLCSMDDFAEMNAVWDAWIDGQEPPARACVESPRLALEKFRVEIQVIAAQQ